MEKIICPNCGKVIIGKTKDDYDEKGNLIQLIDYTCPSCFSGEIRNPQL